MDTSALLHAFCDAVEAHNGKAFAELFTEEASITTCFMARSQVA